MGAKKKPPKAITEKVLKAYQKSWNDHWRRMTSQWMSDDYVRGYYDGLMESKRQQASSKK